MVRPNEALARRLFLVFVFAAIFGAVDAAAQEAERVTLEFAEGPVATSNRVIGLGGAFVSIAEGADGHMFNPASFAVRYPHTRNDFFDWDWTIYWLLPGENTSLDPSQPPGSTGDAAFLGGGLDFKLTALGAGIHGWGQSRTFGVPSSDGAIVRDYTFSQVTAGFGFAFTVPKWQMSFGQFTGPTRFTIAEGSRQVLEMKAGQSLLGFLWAPTNRPVRVGLTYRPPAFLSDTCLPGQDGTCRNLEGLDDPALLLPDNLQGFVPDGFVIPGRVAAGFSFMAWERVYNPPQSFGMLTVDETDPRRRYVLGAVDWHVTAGSAGNVQSFESFLRQEPQRCADNSAATGTCINATFGIRAGVESELIPNWLRLRSGYYFEPTRNPAGRGRHHATGGGDVRIPFWPWDLRANTAVDISSHYFNWGLGLGFWH